MKLMDYGIPTVMMTNMRLQISFHVQRGEVLGFLGPSGAGKSTTQGILTGLLPLQRGEVTVAGYDVKKPTAQLFNKMGVSFEQTNIYGKLSALENLQFFAKLYDVSTKDPMQLLKMVGLEQDAKKKASAYSKGKKHRLVFARSMLNDPEIWFLDEHTTGLLLDFYSGERFDFEAGRMEKHPLELRGHSVPGFLRVPSAAQKNPKRLGMSICQALSVGCRPPFAATFVSRHSL